MRRFGLGSTVTLILVAALAGCGGDEDSQGQPAAAATDQELTAAVTTAFATYRAGVVQGDAAAVRANLTAASLELMSDLAEQARTLDAAATAALPAAEQLLVLTYRLRPDILGAADPYAALVEQGFAGQDRTLGDIGPVVSAGEDRALAAIVDPESNAPTPLRWRFLREEGAWRFDLVEAHRLLSQAIATSAARAGAPVAEVVAATVQDLSGLSAAAVAAAYQPPGR